MSSELSVPERWSVEVELGLTQGVFGQLAAGGDAGSVRRYRTAPGDSRKARRQRRRDRKRSRRLSAGGRDDAVLSERAAVICVYEWSILSSDPRRRLEGEEMAPYVERLREECSPSEVSLFSSEAIRRVCRRFDEASAEWSRLQVGEPLTLRWRGGPGSKARNKTP